MSQRFDSLLHAGYNYTESLMARRVLFLQIVLVVALSLPLRGLAASLSSAHFRYSYDDRQLSAARAESAARDAERAYEYNQERFAATGPPLISCDLTPRFFGATGYSQPGRRPPHVAVRIPDLGYLGLDQVYVLRHEVAHIFSGRLAAGPMGEGLADLIAGGFGDLPLAPWWGSALQNAGLWVDPDGLFITGDYPASAELDARQRIALYTEPALLLQFLEERYGLERVLTFLRDYGRARRSLQSNETTARQRGFRLPDPTAVRGAFQQAFGHSWSELRSGWERRMASATASAADRRRLVLEQKTYGAIRNFEMWVMAQGGRLELQRTAAIRREFTAVNTAIRERRLDDAEARLRVAQGMVDELKRPPLVALASFPVLLASKSG